MKVAILGTGPSAAYAGMACETAEVEYDIISNKHPPQLYPGAFWARLNPLYSHVPAFEVYISKVGTAIEYLKKQWGMVDEHWLEETSFPKESRKEIVYDPMELFGNFWHYAGNPRDIHLVEELDDIDVSTLATRYDLVFMTFATQKSRKEWSQLLWQFPIVTYPSDSRQLYCIYDGEENEHTVRMSNLFGYIHNEYPPGYVPKMELVGDEGKIFWAMDITPNYPNPWNPKDVPADNVVLTGRWAQWDRKVLSHHAYAQVLEILEKEL